MAGAHRETAEAAQGGLLDRGPPASGSFSPWCALLELLRARAREQPGGGAPGPVDRWNQAYGQQFGAWVAEQVRRARSRRGTRVAIPPDRQGDIAQDVLLKLLETAELLHARLQPTNPRLVQQGAFDLEAGPQLGSAALASADELIQGYVQVMLGHRWLEICRKEAREEPIAPNTQAPAGGEEDSADDRLPGALAAIRAALQHVLATRQVDAADTTRAFSELVDLALKERTMDQILAEAMTREEGTPTTLRDRIYRRHRLLRRYLDEALEKLDLEPEDRLAARMALARVLNRRPKKQASSVPGTGDAP